MVYEFYDSYFCIMCSNLLYGVQMVSKFVKLSMCTFEQQEKSIENS